MNTSSSAFGIGKPQKPANMTAPAPEEMITFETGPAEPVTAETGPEGITYTFGPSYLATEQSNMAPKWLVFPTDIINTDNIRHIRKYETTKCIVIEFNDYEPVNIFTNDLEATWSTLQKAFADGVNNGR